MEATLRRVHAGLDRERRRRATVNAFISPNSIQRIDRLVRLYAGIERAESRSVKLADNCAARLIERPARHASIRAAHDYGRLQFDSIGDASNRVCRGIDLERTNKHIPRFVPVLVVGKLVRVLEERSLDRSEVHASRENFTIGVIVPASRSPLHRNLCIRIENHIVCGDFKLHAVERNITIVRRNLEISIRNNVFASRSREVARTERSRELVRALVGVCEIDGRASSGASAPNGIQHHRIVAIVRCSRAVVFRNDSVIQFRECGIAVRGESITLHAKSTIVQSHREALICTFDSVILRHNPVTVIIRLER